MSSLPLPITVAEIISAIRTNGSVQRAADALGISNTLIYARLRSANIDLKTLEPRLPIVFAPGEEEAIRRQLTAKAIALGIWHVDGNGDVQQYYRGDPWKGRVPNLLDDVRP